METRNWDFACSIDAKQAFDNVSPLNPSLVMNEMEIAPLLAGAILREKQESPISRLIRPSNRKERRVRACST